MDKQFHIENRKALMDTLPEGGVAVLFSGNPPHRSADASYNFSVNRNFLYMTGICRENLTLMLLKKDGKVQERLYIDPLNERYQKWIGRQLTPEQATEVSGIEDVRENTNFMAELGTELNGYSCTGLWLDLFRYKISDEQSFEQKLAHDLSKKYPGTDIHSLSNTVFNARRNKKPCELEKIRKAIAITDDGINNMMRHSKPGMFEYEFEANFMYELIRQGARTPAFGTILASGDSATILHYVENNRQTEDGQLLLLDLGADWEGYCADISRTFPVNGKFTERQAVLYSIVLEANRRAIAFAKPGVTQNDINEVVKAYYAEALTEIGLITKPEEVARYYYHGCAHSLGLDVHDVGDKDQPLVPGVVTTIEPGLYIAEEGIGIRIEDDIVITETGCEVLSAGIIKEIADIEAFMAK